MNEVKFKANVEDLKSLSLVVDEIEETVDAIPVPTVADDGKLLGVTLDETGESPVAQYELVDAPDPLPAIASGDAGKVLTVNAGETAAEWAEASGGGASISKSADFSLPAVNATAEGVGSREVTYTATITDASTLLFHGSNWAIDDAAITFNNNVVAYFPKYVPLTQIDPATALTQTQYATDNDLNTYIKMSENMTTFDIEIVSAAAEPPATASIAMPTIALYMPSDEFMAAYSSLNN